MLTYQLKKAPGMPLYEALFRCIRADILSGKLKPGEKLPSKRTLCTNLKISKITVESAYNQLLDQGYIYAREKVGYFVEHVERVASRSVSPALPEKPAEKGIDFTSNRPPQFPFSVWSKLQREVMLDLGEKLLAPLHNQGLPELRHAIAVHLGQFRGMEVDPENIIVGAGTDFLYNLLIQLLGREKHYAVEEPGYEKIRKIYAAAGADCIGVPLDEKGIMPQHLLQAQVLHISPSHHFPTGLVTPLHRRQELLSWASQAPDRWIIEDDYDSEFRFAAHPMPAMQSMDTAGHVIYMNTFSKSLAPSIRISYMILPPKLMALFRNKLGFYSCTVPSFEQHTLACFIERGYFEKHLNRMRKFYKARRNRVLQILADCPYAERLAVQEENAGLHFLLSVEGDLAGKALTDWCAQAGIRVQTLGEFYHGHVPENAWKQLVINYSGLTEEELLAFEEIMKKA